MISGGDLVRVPYRQADALRTMWYGSRASIVRIERRAAVPLVLNFYRERLRWGSDDVGAAYRRRKRVGRSRVDERGNNVLMGAYLRRWELRRGASVKRLQRRQARDRRERRPEADPPEPPTVTLVGNLHDLLSSTCGGGK